MDFEKCKLAFEEYISNYDLKDKMINLKYRHSYAVSELMAELSYRLDLSKEEITLAKIIGLLHDIGRFEQWNKNHSFKDDETNHANEACEYLFTEGHIRDFVGSDKYDSIIEKAIRYHNKYEVPNMEEKELLFTKMVRDMDKVDIYKQSAIHFDYNFKAEEISDEVLKSFKEEKMIDDKNKHSKSDTIIKILSYIYDINFDESFDILVNTDNFDLFLSVIEVDENSEKLWKKIREICFDKINIGIGD